MLVQVGLVALLRVLERGMELFNLFVEGGDFSTEGSGSRAVLLL